MFSKNHIDMMIDQKINILKEMTILQIYGLIYRADTYECQELYKRR